MTELSNLSHLASIEQLTIANNPAVEQPENERRQYDYRPYVTNWCLSLRVLDGILIGAKERLVIDRINVRHKDNNAPSISYLMFYLNNYAQLILIKTL